MLKENVVEFFFLAPPSKEGGNQFSGNPDCPEQHCHYATSDVNSSHNNARSSSSKLAPTA